jgi:hypothetical protein
MEQHHMHADLSPLLASSHTHHLSAVPLRGAKSGAPVSWLYVARNLSAVSSTNASPVPLVAFLATAVPLPSSSNHLLSST